MLVLLAESKTMASNQEAVDSKILKTNTPIFEATADAIMENIENLPTSQIAEILGISVQLAAKAKALAYEFPHKLTGYPALFGFTGEAFKGLDAKSLSEKALENANENLMIISSVYGLLKVSDYIKPYRCEFIKKIGPDNQSPVETYKKKITVKLVNHIKDNKIKDIINLLPGDADKCIDWKIVRAFAKVHKICFQTLSDGGKLKTPIASRLKELRGKMARMILMEDIDNFKDLTEQKTEEFIFSPSDSKPLLPVFISD